MCTFEGRGKLVREGIKTRELNGQLKLVEIIQYRKRMEGCNNN